MAQLNRQYAICIRNEGCDDLLTRKVYEVLSDESAGGKGFLRVIDESGEDYLYPIEYFVVVNLPRKAQQALAETEEPKSRPVN